MKGSKNPLPLDIGSVNYKQAGRNLLLSLDDYSLEEVLKKSNIRVKWNEKFDEIQKAKNKFLNLRIAK